MLNRFFYNKISLEDFPVFNSNAATRSSWKSENCLSYALNIDIPPPSLWGIFQTTTPLEWVKKVVNKHFDDPDLILIAQHTSGKLPDPISGYYLAALFLTKTRPTKDEQIYQQDYHFLVQNRDGYFSHRRGLGDPERVDADNNLISNPEKANLLYQTEYKPGLMTCLNYQFQGYFYFKSYKNRKVGSPIYENWVEIEKPESLRSKL